MRSTSSARALSRISTDTRGERRGTRGRTLVVDDLVRVAHGLERRVGLVDRRVDLGHGEDRARRVEQVEHPALGSGARFSERSRSCRESGDARSVADVLVAEVARGRDGRDRAEQAVERPSRRSLVLAGLPLVEECLLERLLRAVDLPHLVRRAKAARVRDESVDEGLLDGAQGAAEVFAAVLRYGSQARKTSRVGSILGSKLLPSRERRPTTHSIVQLASNDPRVPELGPVKLENCRERSRSAERPCVRANTMCSDAPSWPASRSFCTARSSPRLIGGVGVTNVSVRMTPNESCLCSLTLANVASSKRKGSDVAS